MPSRLPPVDVARVAFEGTYETAAWANIMYFQCSLAAGMSQSIADALVQFLHQTWATKFCPLMTPDAAITNTHLLFNDDGTTVHRSSYVHTDAGTHTAAADLPASAACVISWQTSEYYRGGKPRTYICGLPTNALNDVRTFNTTFITLAQTNAASFTTTVNAHTATGLSSVTHGYVSFVRRGVELEPPVFHPITGALCHNRVDTQRRRLGKTDA